MNAADLWSAMPLMILGVGALVVLLSGAVTPGRYGPIIGVVASLGAAVWALQPSGPESPTLGMSASPFARYFTILFTITAALVLLLSRDWLARRQIEGEEYPATVLFATFGMVAVVGATNLLLLFLGLEALTFAFYLLVAIDRDDLRSAEAGLKYLLIGGTAAAFTAFGLALIYAATGTLEIAAAMKDGAGGASQGIFLAGWGLLLAGMAFKVSLVPFHLWTPDVYEGAPTPVAAFLAAGSKAAAVAALIMLLTATRTSLLHDPLWALSLFSMIVGNLAALRQQNIKRMLGYSAVAQMGYVVMALLAGNSDGYGAAAFYLVVYSAMNLAAFGAVGALTGDDSSGIIDEFRCMGYHAPFRSGVLALALLALAGIPPTAGFTGKFALFRAALTGGEVALAVVGMLTAVASVYYYLRIVATLYFRPSGATTTEPVVTAATMIPLAIAAFLLLLFGIWPGFLLGVTRTITG